MLKRALTVAHNTMVHKTSITVAQKVGLVKITDKNTPQQTKYNTNNMTIDWLQMWMTRQIRRPNATQDDRKTV